VFLSHVFRLDPAGLFETHGVAGDGGAGPARPRTDVLEPAPQTDSENTAVAMAERGV
jgi:hypothetical protein